MALERKPPSEPSCPLWLATYGDLVTNLLVFFVLLMSLSELKKEDQLISVMEAIREAFGYSAGVTGVPLEEEIEIPRNIDWTQIVAIPVHDEGFSKVQDEAVEGPRPQVEARRPANYFAIGGPIQFSPLSVELSAEQRARLAALAETIRGYSTQIEVRGHASSYPVEGCPFRNHYDIAYQRAEAGAMALVELGVEPHRLLAASSGTNQPVSANAFTFWEKRQNDLVELLQTDVLVNEFRP